MGLFKSRPLVIEAVQLRWTNWGEICEFLGGIVSPDNPGRHVETYSDTCGEEGPHYIELTIPTLEGEMIARHGDWIIKGVNGEFYPCKPDIFAKTYQAGTHGSEERATVTIDREAWLSLRGVIHDLNLDQITGVTYDRFADATAALEQLHFSFEKCDRSAYELNAPKEPARAC